MMQAQEFFCSSALVTEGALSRQVQQEHNSYKILLKN